MKREAFDITNNDDSSYSVLVWKGEGILYNNFKNYIIKSSQIGNEEFYVNNSNNIILTFENTSSIKVLVLYILYSNFNSSSPEKNNGNIIVDDGNVDDKKIKKK